MDVQAKLGWRTYATSFLVWSLIALYFFSQGLTQRFLSGDPTPWWHYLVAWFTCSYVAAVLTPPAIWLIARFPFERTNWKRRAFLHLLFGLAFASIQLVVESGLLFRFGVFPVTMRSYRATFFFLFMVGFHQNLTTYWVILALQYSLRYYRGFQERERQALRLELGASELNSQLAHARLSTLKMQLQPHFLFNTLNAIMVLVRQRKTREAEQTLALLSDLLRSVLDDVEAHEVPLRRELEYLRLYLSIEQIRFQDRLRVTIAAGPEVLDASFPHMALQPVVENAIRHGIARRAAAGSVQIVAVRTDHQLQVSVEDDGPGFNKPHNFQTHGIGLANTRARLHELYQDDAWVTTENRAKSGARVTLTIPFHKVPETPALGVMEVHAIDDANC